MNEVSVIVIAAVAGMFSGAVTQLVITWRTRNLTQAQAKKEGAEADAITSGEWRRLYEKICTQVDIQNKKIEQQDIKIDNQGDKVREQGYTIKEQGEEIIRQANELDIYKDTVQYLWLGTVDNINFMKAQGLDPPFEPKLNYRGDDDFDYNDWKWLDSPPDGIGENHET